MTGLSFALTASLGVTMAACASGAAMAADNYRFGTASEIGCRSDTVSGQESTQASSRVSVQSPTAILFQFPTVYPQFASTSSIGGAATLKPDAEGASTGVLEFLERPVTNDSHIDLRTFRATDIRLYHQDRNSIHFTFKVQLVNAGDVGCTARVGVKAVR